MITWTTQDASRARLALKFLLKYVQDAGLTRPLTILTKQLINGLEAKLEDSLKKFKKEASAAGIIHEDFMSFSESLIC